MSRSRVATTSLLKLKQDVGRRVSSEFHGGWFSLVVIFVLVVGAVWFLVWLPGWP